MVVSKDTRFRKTNYTGTRETIIYVARTETVSHDDEKDEKDIGW